MRKIKISRLPIIIYYQSTAVLFSSNSFSLQSLWISSFAFSHKMNFLCEATNNNLQSEVAAKRKKEKKMKEELCFVWTGALSWLLMFSDVCFLFKFTISFLPPQAHTISHTFNEALPLNNKFNKQKRPHMTTVLRMLHGKYADRKKWNEFYGGRKYWTTRHTMLWRSFWLRRFNIVHVCVRWEVPRAFLVHKNHFKVKLKSCYARITP